MQVVINIPETAYTACKVCKDVEEQETTLFGALCDAVANGTPLPKGHWTHDGSQWINRWVCSECGSTLFYERQNYCPNCGAKMDSEKESE